MKKFILSTLVTTTLLGSVLPSVTVIASSTDNIEEVKLHSELEQPVTDIYNPNSDSPSMSELKKLDLSENTINEINSITYSGLQVNSTQNTQGEITVQGKFSATVKVIRAGWNKLPKKVRRKIASYVGIGQFLAYLEQLTGTVENALYKTCRHFGMSSGWSTFVSKTIVFFIL